MPPGSIGAGDFRSGPGLGVRRTELVKALRACADKAGVEVVRGTATEVRDDRETTSVGDAEGRTWTGDLVLGCDGLSSCVQAIGVEVTATGPRRYGLVAHFAARPWDSVASRCTGGGLARRMSRHWGRSW